MEAAEAERLKAVSAFMSHAAAAAMGGGGPGGHPMGMNRGKSGQLRPAVGGKSNASHDDGAAAAALHAEAIEKLRDELGKMRDDRDSAVQLRQASMRKGIRGCYGGCYRECYRGCYTKEESGSGGVMRDVIQK